MTTELAIVEPAEIEQRQQSNFALRDAARNILQQPGMMERIDGKPYIKAEGWRGLASLLGISMNDNHAPIEWVPDQTKDNAKVATATVRVWRGAAESIATGSCSTAERQGRSHHSCEAMARTRATNRALRFLIGGVPTMAMGGRVSETPAEEMDHLPTEQTMMRRGSQTAFIDDFERKAKAAGWTADADTIERVKHDMQAGFDSGRLNQGDIETIMVSIVTSIRAEDIGKDEAWAVLGQAIE